MNMNLPTKITVARIALIPLVLILYYLIPVSPVFILLMTAVYIFASATDAIDGHIARSRNLVTTLGKFLDPIADKVLVLAGLFIIVDSGVLSWGRLGMLGSVIILARELAISAFRQIAASKGVIMAADKLGKIKTIFTLICIPALFLGMYKWHDNNAIHIIGEIFFWFGAVMFALSVILTIWSGINYIVKNKQVFVDEEPESHDESETRLIEDVVGDETDANADVIIDVPTEDIEIDNNEE